MAEKEVQKALENFIDIKLKDAKGIALKSHAEGIKKFKRVSFISCFANEASYASQSLYKDSLVIIDFLRPAPLIIPKINGTYVYGRNLKQAELESDFPARLFHSLLANERGINVPRIIGYFSTNESPLVLTEYHGQQNLMSALSSGVRRQDFERQKAASTAIRAYWWKEHQLCEKYLNLEHIDDVLGGKSSIHFERLAAFDRNSAVLQEAQRKYGADNGTVPCYINSLIFLIEKGELKGQAEKDLIEYLSLRKNCRQEELGLMNFNADSFDGIDEVCRKIGRGLRVASEKGVLLLDVAPRDIILDVNGSPWFADMENVEFHNSPLAKSQQDRQMLAVKGEFMAPNKKCPYTKKELLKFIEKSYYE